MYIDRNFEASYLYTIAVNLISRLININGIILIRWTDDSFADSLPASKNYKVYSTCTDGEQSILLVINMDNYHITLEQSRYINQHNRSSLVIIT